MQRLFICSGSIKTNHDLSSVSDFSSTVLKYCGTSYTLFIRVAESGQKLNQSFSDVQSRNIFVRIYAVMVLVDLFPGHSVYLKQRIVHMHFKQAVAVYQSEDLNEQNCMSVATWSCIG